METTTAATTEPSTTEAPCTPNLDMVQESSTTFEASFDERDDDDDNATNPDSVYNNYVDVRCWINDL